MALTYGGSEGSFTTSDLSSNLESTVGASLAQQILATLNNLGGLSDDPNAAAPTTVSEYTGGAIPEDTAILAFDPSVSGDVVVPDVPVVIFSGTGGVATVIDSTKTGVAVFGAGDDTVTATGGSAATFDLGSGDNKLDASEASGPLDVTVSGGNNDIDGGLGADTFNINGGGGSFDGGSGFDAAKFDGEASEFDVAFDEATGKVTVTNKSSGETSVVENTEYLNVAGKIVVVVNSEDQATAATLFEAILGRASDQGGAKAFTSAAKNGADLSQLAETMLTSQEFAAKNGGKTADQLSNDEFIAAMYQNLFDRGLDSGAQNWINALNAGVLTKAQAVVQLAKSLESDIKTDDTIKVTDKTIT
ncbi:DUF4214 domain-containing protein [Rhabdaerophilum sp. SD176]|uniref:DUF4214 domain-containing protein n=1 Tax=Rhabdaerophilum sp. SD176 TaxID=2983548 RepID=UPI0024DFC783|nr:DUF4214 domain-containing protein [Rhabdaerophilum sp. SD176]